MRRLILPAILLFLAAACTPSRVPPAPTAEHYLQEGESYFDKGLYKEAIASWEKVRESYYSPELNSLAEMKIAEAHYLAEEYVESAAAYEDFLKAHPNHERTPQILYLLGMSYFNQMLSADRDQTATRNALVTFQSLAKRFPESPRAREVAPFIERCKNRLADHELYVGNFYLRTEHYEAAIHRFKGIFTLFPDFRHRDRAYFLLGKAYLDSGQREKAAEAFKALQQEFPDSEDIDEAHQLMDNLD